MDFEESTMNGDGGLSDKQPMYVSTQDNSPVSRGTFACTVGLLIVVSFGLLVVVILCLNGTIAPVNDVHFIRPADVEDMDELDVVKQTMLQCRTNLAMNITKLEFSPHPLILPDRAFDLTYEMELMLDMPEDVNLQVVVQRLEPPWKRLPCVNNMGSCTYQNACGMIGEIFGKKSCMELKKGKHSQTISSRMIDPMGPLGWAKSGNYFIHARINKRDEMFGCVVMSFRIRNKP